MSKKGLLKTIFLLILLVFPLGQLCRFQVPNFPGVILHPLDFLVFFFNLGWLFKHFKQKEKLVAPNLFLPMLVFAAVAGFSLLIRVPALSLSDFLLAFFYWLRLFNFFLFYWTLTDFFRKEKLPVFNYLFYVGIVIAVLSLVQYMFWPDTRVLFSLGWDEHYFRAIGPFADPALTALFLVLALILMLVVDRAKTLRVKSLPLRLTAGLLLFLALTLSFSRMAYFLLIFATALIFLLKRRFWIFPVLTAVLILMIFFAPKPGGEGVDLLRKSSLVSRFANYRQALIIAKDNLLFGVGFNNFRLAQKRYGFLSSSDWQTTHSGAGADNSFLFVLATCGLPGLFSYILLWLLIVKQTLGGIRENPLSLLVFTTSLVLLLSSFFVNSLFYPWVLVWFFILLAKFTVQRKA